MLTIKDGFEALMFQQKSVLGEDLTKIFQEVIDYRDNLTYENINPKQIIVYQNKKVVEFFKVTSVPKIKATYKKNTNVIVERVITSTTPCGQFAIDLSLDDMLSVNDLLLQEYGRKRQEKTPSKSLKELMDLYKQLDTTTGKTSSSNFGKDRQLSCVLYMDVACAFLAKNFFPNGAIEDMTAKEIAAIELHETGHMFSMIERSTDVFLQIPRAISQFDSMTKNNSNIEIIDALYDNKQDILNLLSTDEVSKKLVPVVDKTIESLKYYEQQDNSSWGSNIFNLFTESIKVILRSLIWLILAAYCSSIFQYLLKALVQCSGIQMVTDAINEYSGSKLKQSDVANSSHNWFISERDADEYAVRSGFGGELASGLNKLIIMINYISTVGVVSPSHPTVRNSVVFLVLYKLCSVLKKFISFNFPMSTVYEKDEDRFKRMGQSLIPVFKQNLPPEMRMEYIAQYEKIMKVLDDRKSQLHPTLDTIMNYLNIASVPSKFLSMVLTGRLANDFNKLQNQIEELMNNKLYYQAAKFKSMI